MTVVNNQVAAQDQHTCGEVGDFAALQTALNAHYEATRTGAKDPVMTTDVDPDALFATYLAGFPDDLQRQHHTCTACRRFIKNYGNLVMVSTNSTRGVITPLMWPQTQTHLEAIYRKPIKNLYTMVKKAKVNGVFLSSDKEWGIKGNRDFVTGQWWNHFGVSNRDVWNNRLLTANQAMAAKTQGYQTVLNALAKYKPEHLALALQLLEGDSLYRQEKVIGPARWLKALQDNRATLREPQKSAYTWAMIGAAPEAFLHPTSSMISTLLDDIAAGMDFEQVKRRFAEKMSPLSYQRPQAAPAAGNVKRAEEIVRKLGVERSFERRFATFNDMSTVWLPTLVTHDPYADKKPAAMGGIFGHVPTKTYAAAPAQKRQRMNVGVQTMTWQKFQSTIMPSAEQIEVFLESSGNNIAGFQTARHADAPPILCWDYEDARNPVSWYIYQGGSRPEDWHIRSGWVNCIGITLRPHLWNAERPVPNQGVGGAFLLEGAYDRSNPGMCLFPETLIPELREVRATIESFSRNTRVPAANKSNIAGKVFGGSSTLRIRVTTATTVGEIIIDRWE